MEVNKNIHREKREKKRIAITYSRCSTKKQDLDSQNKRLNEWASKFDKHIHYEDLAISGRKDDRKGINSLMEYVKTNQSNEVEYQIGIIELSRLGRSISFIHKTIEELSSYNVKVVLVNSGTILDYKSLEGRALIGGLSLAADIEWMLISERNKRGRDKIKENNIKVGRKHQEISLTAINSLKEKGFSLREIAKELNTSPQTIMRRLNEIRILNNLELTK